MSSDNADDTERHERIARDVVAVSAAEKRQRSALVWSAIAVCLLAGGAVLAMVVALRVVVGAQDSVTKAEITTQQLRVENGALSDRVNRSTRETECRSRISVTASDAESQANANFRSILIDRAAAGQTQVPGLGERVLELVKQNERVLALSKVRADSVALCSANPDYQP